MTDDGPDPFTNMFEAPAKLARALFAPMAEATAGTPISAPAAIADRNVTPKKRPRPLGSRAFIRPPMTTPHETSLP